jgi:hypothetical protein
MCDDDVAALVVDNGALDLLTSTKKKGGWIFRNSDMSERIKILWIMCKKNMD